MNDRPALRKRMLWCSKCGRDVQELMTTGLHVGSSQGFRFDGVPAHQRVNIPSLVLSEWLNATAKRLKYP